MKIPWLVRRTIKEVLKWIGVPKKYIKPIMKGVKRMTLPKGKGTLAMILSVVLQAASIALDVVPEQYKFIPIAVIGAIQLYLLHVGYNSNPDGSPVALPYDPTKK